MIEKTAQEYTSADIDVLTEREHVRKRTSVYLGNTQPATYVIPDLRGDEYSTFETTFIPAAYTAIGEIVDNSIDEFEQIDAKNKTLKIDSDHEAGVYVVEDTGRGVPIDKHKTGDFTPAVVFSTLRSGRNFKSNRAKGVKGMNGVGSAVTNYVSKEFDIKIHRDGKEYVQNFSDGALVKSEPKIATKKYATTGTQIKFQLDDQVFPQVAIDEALIENRVLSWAFSNPNVKVIHNGKNIQQPKGMSAVLNRIFKGHKIHEFVLDEPNVQGSIYVIPTMKRTEGEVHVWVNSSLLLDGGLSNTQITNAFIATVQTKLAARAKREKINITSGVVREGLLIFANLKIEDPEYNGQAKLGLTGPNLRNEYIRLFDSDWTKFSRSNSDWINDMAERAAKAYHAVEDNKAAKEHEDRIKRKLRVEGLIDATGKDRMNCRILLTEGDSASVRIQEARNPVDTAALATSGKFNNVHGTTVAQLLKMGKVADLLATIGLVPGKKADRNKLRYGRVVISVDADFDGQDIFCNFINLFYKFWPELLDPNEEPFIYKLIVPNVVVQQGKKRIHFKNRLEYDEVAHKHRGDKVEYMKGLGSLQLSDWEMVLSDREYELPILADEHTKEVLELLFGNDSDARKEWLENNSPVEAIVQSAERVKRAKEVASSEYILQARKEYALYALSTRSVPSLADGLIKGARRNLWKARSGKIYKTDTLSGATMSIHPHADTSGIINSLTAYYANNIPLLKGHGAFGTRLSPGAFGAGRYTSVELSRFTKDVVFADLNIIPMIENYDGTEMEPEHFLPLVPVALLNPNSGIAIGYSTKILPRELGDIIDCQLNYLQGKANEELIMPSMTIIDSKAVDHYPTPKGVTYVFRGSIERTNTSECIITNLPYGLERSALLKHLDKLVDAGDIVSYLDGSTKTINIVVRFGRGKLKDLTDDEIINTLNLIGTENEILRVLDFTGTKVVDANPIELIEMFTEWRLQWFKKRFEVIVEQLTKDLSRSMDVRLAIDHKLNEVVRTLRNKSDVRDFLASIGVCDIEYIADLPVYRFSQDERDAIDNRIAALEAEIQQYLNKMEPKEMKKEYIKELREVLKAYNKGTYDTEIL